MGKMKDIAMEIEQANVVGGRVTVISHEKVVTVDIDKKKIVKVEDR